MWQIERRDKKQATMKGALVLSSLAESSTVICSVYFALMFICLESQHVWKYIEYVMQYCFYGATESLINHSRNEPNSIHNAV